MIDTLWQFGFSNLLVSLALALVAWAVQLRGKRPHVAHVLWLLVIAKLVTPPLFNAPVVEMPQLFATSSSALSALSALPEDGSTLLPLSAFALEPTGGVEVSAGRRGTVIGLDPATALTILWLAGSLAVLGWSLLRIARFHRLLATACEDAPREVQELASRLGRQLGLSSKPTVCTFAARISPMVWWIGGRVRVLLPAALLDGLQPAQLRHVLAHELAHVARRDHLVRWLEWLACVCFWWNPVAWWARRQLRANEEICCDALVMSSLRPQPHAYANSLLNVAEFLVSPALRPPAMASRINNDGFLKRRFTMIMSGKLPSTPTLAVRASALLFAVALLPLGVAYAQDAEGDHELLVGIKAGELTVEEARAVFDALPPVEWVAQRYTAGVDKLDAAVEAGKLTADEAELEKQGIADRLQTMAFYMEVYGVSAEQAKARIPAHDGERDHDGEGNHDTEREWMGHLMRAGVPREQVRDVFGAAKKIAAERTTDRRVVELDPAMRGHLVGMGLTDDQIELVQGIAMRMAVGGDHQRKQETHAWMIEHLERAGVDREQMEGTIGGITKLAHMIRKDGADQPMHLELRAHFVQLGLSFAQIGLAHDLARRQAEMTERDEPGIEEHFQRLGVGKETLRTMMETLHDGGITREQFEPVLGGVVRIMMAQRAQDRVYVLDDKMRAHFVEVGLSDQQIERVMEVARTGLANGKPATDRPVRAR